MYKVPGKFSLDCKSSVNIILTSDEEMFLVEWILKSAKTGFPITKNHVLDNVAMLIGKLKRPSNFTRGRPKRHWYDSFLQRHKEFHKE